MSKLILHDKFETTWNSLGFGPLNDAILPRVTRGRNAEYTLEFQYPVKGVLFDKIKTGNWVVTNAGTKSYTENQRFEIQTVTKPINGIVTVYAEHYRYQLLRSVLKKSANFTGRADDVMKTLLNISIPKYDFEISPSLRLEQKEIKLDDPSKFENTMEAFGGATGSVLDLFGGEYIFDNNKISLPEKAGKETGIVVAYGKNLVDITQEDSIENTFTSIYPWAKYTPEAGAGDGEEQGEQIITVDGDYVDGEHIENYRVRRIESVDFSNKKPTNKAELLEMAKSYVKNNNVGVPKVSIKTKFVDLTKSVQSGDISRLEEIDLCDYITVAFNELNINAVAQVTKVVWRPDLEQFETVELGDARTNLGDVIIDNTVDKDEWRDKLNDLTDDWKNKYFDLQKDIERFGDVINNPGEGHVVVYPSLADPQEIYIMDTTNIDTAKKMWRWNEAGLAYSKTGRNGPWVVGMNKEGQIVADLISTGTLRAIDIIGVTITGSTVVSTGADFDTTIRNGSILWHSKKLNRDVIEMHAQETTQSDVGELFYQIKPGGGFRIVDTKGNLVLSTYDNGTNAGTWLSFSTKEYHWFGTRRQGGDAILEYMSHTPFSWICSVNSFTMEFDNTGGLDVGGHTQLNNTQALFRKNVRVDKDLRVYGSKNSTVNTETYGQRLLNAYETPEYYFADYGEAITGEDCKARVDIDPIFAETVNLARYMTHVTPTKLVLCAVTHEEKDHFIIETSEPNVLVRWNVIAHRLGYEDVRLKQDELSDK